MKSTFTKIAATALLSVAVLAPSFNAFADTASSTTATATASPSVLSWFLGLIGVDVARHCPTCTVE